MDNYDELNTLVFTISRGACHIINNMLVKAELIGQKNEINDMNSRLLIGSHDRSLPNADEVMHCSPLPVVSDAFIWG